MHAVALLAQQGDVLAVDATAIIIFIIALFLIWLQNILLFKPINEVLDERDNRTRGYQSEAKAMIADRDRQSARYEKAIRQARAEVYESLEQRRKQALDRRAREIEAAKKDFSERVASAQQQVDLQVGEAKTHLAIKAKDLAREIAGTLAGRPIEEIKKPSS